MSYNPHQQGTVPLWDFLSSLDPTQPGRGVDHSGPFFPFANGPHRRNPGWAPWFDQAEHQHEQRGRQQQQQQDQQQQQQAQQQQQQAEQQQARRPRNHTPDSHESDNDDPFSEKRDSPNTVTNDAPDPAEVAPEQEQGDQTQPGTGPRGRGCRTGGGPGPRGRGCGRGRGGFHRGRHAHPFFNANHHPGGAVPAPFDFSTLFSHPFFQNFRPDASTSPEDQTKAFKPPMDTFVTPTSYVLHVSLPGAQKSDIGVNWNPDSHTLSISGVVHRPGDEVFLQSMTSGERRVGLFERDVTLPPEGQGNEKEEIDGDGIVAKMEDGVLVVTVPKVEKEWTEVRKVDIQ